MKLAQLKTLIKQGESEILEFKSSTANLSAGMETVCAFLNSDHGGIVLFGVKDDGKIVGQIVTDKTRKDLACEINKIDPTAKIDIKFISTLKELSVIALCVSYSPRAPYTYIGRAFIRNQSTTMRMLKDEYQYLYNKNNMPIWESLPNLTCKISDLDSRKIKELVNIAVFEKRLSPIANSASISEILTKLDLVVDNKITNAAVILFCKIPEKEFIQSNLKMARFAGVDKAVFLDMKEFRGNAFDLYDKAMDFLHFNLPVAAHIEQGKAQRVERPTIPYSVLREAVTNALVHRDYSFAGGTLTIAIYNDRLTITNPGSLRKGLLQQLTVQHPSILRNPVIARFFYLCRKIEGWGRGTLDMITDCKNVGNPIPIYEEVAGDFLITLPFKNPIHNLAVEKREVVTNSGLKAGAFENDFAHSSPGLKAPGFSGLEIKLQELTDRQLKILDALKSGALSRTKIMTKMNSLIGERTIQAELLKLKKLGLIVSKGKTKAVIWSIA